jgi:iron complex transport system ATP-binding protein
MNEAYVVPSLECRDLTLSVPGRELLRGLDMALRPGSIVALLGRNGAGKSTLLHTLAGLRPAAGGEVSVLGRGLGDWTRRELARHLALLPQSSEDPFPGTVLQSALVGRHPHLHFWQWEGDADRTIAGRSLAEMDLAGLEDREISTLSGGERRRLAMAAVLAQDPDIYLLDEPAQQLDPSHELQLLQKLRALAAAGRSVVMSLHDAGLAARFSSESLLLHGDGGWSFGPTGEVLNEDSIGRLYGLEVRELRWDQGRTFVPAGK